MTRRFGRHLRQHFVAYIALFFALGGTAIAAKQTPIFNGTPAGGDLTGTYPDPQIAPNAVGSAEVADNSLTGDDILESSLAGVDAAKLGGLSASDVGLGFFTGRVKDIPTEIGISSGAPSGVSTANEDLVNPVGQSPLATLSPDRTIVLRDLSVKLTNPVVGSSGDEMQAGIFGPGAASFVCSVLAGESSCTASGPSGIVAANSRLAFFVHGIGGATVPAGTDALFSWRAGAP